MQALEVQIVDIKKILVLGGVAVGSAAVGILLPDMIVGGRGTGSSAPAHADTSHAAPADHGKEPAKDHGAHEEKKDKGSHEAPKDAHSAEHGGAAGEHGPPEKPKEGPQYLPFGQIVVNLNVPDKVIYLSLDIVLQADARFEKEVKEAMDARKVVLKTWLVSHLADKTLNDIHGKAGVNQLRREIQDNFNSLLFKDGHERVQDILFEEYHVQ